MTQEQVTEDIGHILVVDDYPMNRIKLSRVLEQQGHTVSAFDICDARVPDHARRIFRQDSALSIDYSEYDLIVCPGLLYHLSLSQQVSLVEKWKGLPVILDTHICIEPSISVVNSGLTFDGLFREPTWSTKVGQAFVHTLDSLRRLMNNWTLVDTKISTVDRVTCHFVPQSASVTTLKSLES